MERMNVDIIQILQLKEGTRLILDGWAFSPQGSLPRLEVRINGTLTPAQVTPISRPDIQQLANSGTDLLGFSLQCQIQGPIQSVEINGHPIPRKRLEKATSTNDILLDITGIEDKDGWTYLEGTVSNLDHTQVLLSVTDSAGRVLPAHVVRFAHPGHVSLGYENQPAFLVTVPTPADKKVVLQARDKDYLSEFPLVVQNAGQIRQLIAKARSAGWKGSVRKALQKFRPAQTAGCAILDPDYMAWREQHQPDLEAQRNTTFAYQPKFSVVTAAWNTPLHLMDQLITSLEAQTYDNWQLCIADGSDNENLQNHMRKYADHPKIKYKRLEANLGISGNTNAAIDLAEGDYIAFMDHDDFLSPDAFYENAKALQEVRHDFLYSDEDNAVEDGSSFCGPYFKPDFSPELLQSNNYITHFTVVSRQLLDRVGKLNPDMDGAQDYDFILRATEKAQSIHHIPKVLYHWRQVAGSTALGIGNKSYALENGKKALAAHFARMGKQTEIEIMDAPFGGCYHTTFPLEQPPLVSIVTKGKPEIADDIPYEIVKHSSEAKGEVLLFLDENIVSGKPGCLSELLGILSLPGVGAVGGKVLNPDRTIQSAGLVLLENGEVCAAFAGHRADRPSRNSRIDIVSDFSAVSESCLMTTRKLWEEKDSEDAVSYCLALAEAGMRTALNPFSVWQSAKYGWPQDRAGGSLSEDPYHNPNYASAGPAFFMSLEESE